MNRPSSSTPGKLLLFGEHVILKGSQALATPLDRFYGLWSAEGSAEPAYQLMPFAAHLHHLSKTSGLLANLDTSRFCEEAASGLSFESNIPVGYGAGSSGALCAAVLKRYGAASGIKARGLGPLRAMLAQMESFFHGESSGTDPLICYLEQTVLLEGAAVAVVAPPKRESGLFFLIDTGISRSTAPWVRLFLERCGQAAFAAMAKEELIPATRAAIAAYLSKDTAGLLESIGQISALQWLYFRDFIPEAFQGLWEQGLSAQAGYRLKLCGAGGGGFILGYATGPDAVPVREGVALLPKI
ncbi:mevalonate kinase family protein [Phaeodactylibacter luteus]|uniref:Mevalonate kinase n=1 Tax=Phaeodactylibacter luteus TaxID=1564516 RepID=A0A5C6RZT8_9BACT|nr:mevalonate kinase [Phaeodactylibacter luteus]TXB67918.1 mevalonate kinase [Phaeodactylibacter luteus]